MEENLAEVVVVINKEMKKIIILVALFIPFIGFSQTTTNEYKKRVLETAEVDLVTSFYSQDGDNAAVTGGIGTEKLTDLATSFTVSIPLNDNDVFTVDATISAYTSASSSNLNPFDASGSGIGYDDDYENDRDKNFIKNTNSIAATSGASSPVLSNNTLVSGGASPWYESTGASRSDVWVNGTFDYHHSSEDRNTILNANVSFASEYDYSSFGFGGGLTKLFNEKNTEIGLKSSVYLDNWSPVYPTEINSYLTANQNINNGFFSGVDILNQNGNIIDKNGTTVWSPINTTLVENNSRNTYSLSVSFSQILTKKMQVSIFFDLVKQEGWLANPMQRVYFADKANYYIGSASNIQNYTSPTNTNVFQLADDIERLPNSRLKLPIGLRLNQYINEIITLRTYFRYYYDDWGIESSTAEIELPIKLSDKFTFYPSYRYYNQTAADYFAPYEQHTSTEEFYTSDYDLSEFNANQFGIGFSYTDIFTKRHIWKLGLKSVDIKYNYYERNTGLNAGIISAGFKFVMD
jgi:hypothetical protein